MGVRVAALLKWENSKLSFLFFLFSRQENQHQIHLPSVRPLFLQVPLESARLDRSGVPPDKLPGHRRGAINDRQQSCLFNHKMK